VYFAFNDTMDFSLNDHQKLTRDTVRQFMENEVRPSVKQRDREAEYRSGFLTNQ
jgi:alkylation response protein AidB-like acyl-CoA dehydrogenase